MYRWQQRISLQALSGALVWSATPGLGEQAWLAPLALLPLLLSLSGCRPLPALLWGFCGGLWYGLPGKFSSMAHALAILQQPAWFEFAALGLLFASYALPFAAFALLWCRLIQPHPTPFSAWFGGFLFAACTISFPALFPYTPVSMLSSQPYWLQLADLGGEPLLLGLLLTTTLGAAQCLSGFNRTAGALALLLPATLASLYAEAVWPRWNVAPPQRISIHSLQSQWPRQSSDLLLLRDRSDRSPRSAVELSRSAAAASPQCQLQLWPESARREQWPDHLCQRAQSLARELDIPILASCQTRNSTLAQPGERGQHPDSHPTRLSAAYFKADESSQHALKSRLVPVFESRQWNSPAVNASSRLFRLSQDTLLLPAICYEIHFPDDLRRAVRLGAQIIAHAANFTAFGDPIVSQWDLAMRRLRAIELRRSIVSSVNQGLAGSIDTLGRWQPTAAHGQSATHCHQVALEDHVSVYTRWGNAIFWCLLALFSLLHGRSGMRREGQPQH